MTKLCQFKIDNIFALLPWTQTINVLDETQTTICCSIWAGTDNFSKSIVRSTVSLSTIMQWPIHNTFKANERFSMGTLTRMKSIHFTKEHNKICMFSFFLNYFTSNINHYFNSKSQTFLFGAKLVLKDMNVPKCFSFLIAKLQVYQW